MTPPMFVWLGSGRARKRHVLAAGVWLDQAARAGLPVPAGAIVLDEFYRFSLDNQLLRVVGPRLIIADAELWHNTLVYSVRLPRFERPVFVRALDQAATAPAGLNNPVDFSNAAGSAAAFEAVWSSWPASSDEAARRDVLIIETIPGAQWGAAATDSNADVDWVTSGDNPASELQALSQLTGRRRPAADTPAPMRRLQQLLRGVRRTLGPGRWRVEWADDGCVCWLTGVVADYAQPPG